MRTTLTISLFLLLFATQINAQGWCNSFTTARASASPIGAPRGGMELTIPVVVHVVSHETAEDISDAQIHSQMTALNADFRKLNTDLSDVLDSTNGGYAGDPADMEINFVLVTTDLAGNPHPGIIRVSTSESMIYSKFENGKRKLCYDELGGSSAWCTSCYLNIWVTNLPEGVAGKAIYPTDIGTETPAEEDGLYISPDRFGTIGENIAPPYHFGRTVTHEVGHYFNLYHLWGAGLLPNNCPASVCCEDSQYDDLVADTNKQNNTYQDECPSGGQFTCGNHDNFQNFMNYTDDACLLMFTEGQKTRAWEAINTYRSGFLNNNCVANSGCMVNTIHPFEELLSQAFYSDGSLYFTPIQRNMSFQLFNSSGQRITQFSSKATESQKRNIGNLPSGVYFLQAHWQSFISTKKIIILR